MSRVGDRAERLISPELQRERIAAYAEVRGLRVEMLEPELDVSGGKAQRPILDEILVGIEAGRFGGVIVAQLDRLSRLGLADAHRLIERIEGAGGKVVAVAENFDAATPEGELGRNVMLSIARMQRQRHASAFADAKARAVAQGIWPLPVVPIGYRRRADRRLEPDPRVAPRVVRAFSARAAGDSWSQVGSILDRGRTGAAKVIRNRVYLGEIHYGDWVNTTAHEGIVDRELWEAAQLPFPRPPRGRAGPSLLAGLIRCAGCRCLMSPADTRKWLGYRCQSTLSRGRCAAPALIAKSIVEPAVEGAFLAAVRSWAFTQRAGSDEVEGARAALADAERELDAFQRGVEASGVGVDHIADGLRLRVERVEDARRLLGEARSRLTPLVSGSVVGLWPDLSVAERRHLLGSAFGVVWVRKGRGPARERVKIADAVPPDLPRPGFGASEVRPVAWEDIEESAPISPPE